ncbi:hypothetical protein [Pseudoalteromonas rubra]|uniref:hypothetical protein n=1 Tax=Pseudoalteromonas rubra TaxID=43658 RepID=UPI000F791C0C|nr:hypothetical protein [Pseudoalteromonas rubra]
MLNLKALIVILSFICSFSIVQSLERPAQEIKVTNDELGMNFEEQLFESSQQAQSYLNELHEKREATLQLRLIERKRLLDELKTYSIALFVLALVSVFIVLNETDRLWYSGILFLFSVIEWWRFAFSGLVLGLFIIALIQLLLYFYRNEGRLSPDWDKKIKGKFKSK